MKILHVNSTDLGGRRFNGYDLMQQLADRGFASKQVVLEKSSRNPSVIPLLKGGAEIELQDRLVQVEYRHAMHGLLFPWGRVLAEMPEFLEADVVHYHLIHSGVVSLLDLPGLTAMKPSVWTVHDPWAFTGHCVYPMACSGWRDECDPCPHLDLPYPMPRDCASRMWRLKKRVYSEVDADLIVASEFMMDMLKKSALTSRFENVHLIPFGIDACSFLPQSAKAVSRESLGISPEEFVILFRSTTSPFKGLPSIIEALSLTQPSRPTVLLTVDQEGLLNDLRGKYRVIDMGWIQNDGLYERVLSAADVLLMPSTAEAFGLMALEAMAAGRPVVSFEGTSLPRVTRAPDCGIAVPMRDSVALRAAIDLLAGDSAEIERRDRKSVV